MATHLVFFSFKQEIGVSGKTSLIRFVAANIFSFEQFSLVRKYIRR